MKQGICSSCGDDTDNLDQFDICKECQANLQEEEYINAGLDGSSL